jgi:hypothetical protein
MFPSRTFVTVIHTDHLRRTERARIRAAERSEEPARHPQPKPRHRLRALVTRIAFR